MCEANLNDDVYDKVTLSSITGVTLSADFGVFREIAPTRGGAISRNPQIRTEMTPVILLPLLRKHFTYKTYQCKFKLIVPEKGWFGQPKHSTPSKILPTLYRSF